jgi:hypothetical protein
MSGDIVTQARSFSRELQTIRLFIVLALGAVAFALTAVSK